jgi:polysaccharide export outer membrane protein
MSGIRNKKCSVLQIAHVFAFAMLGGCQTTFKQVPATDPSLAEDRFSSTDGHGLLKSPTASLEYCGLRNREVIAPVPKELVKVCLPDYRVESPDILLIEAVRAVPKPPYRAEPLDVLFISLAKNIPDQSPLIGSTAIETDGTINLGISYGGSVSVAGLTLPEIKKKIQEHLVNTIGLKDPQVNVSLAQGRAGQRISGPHLVRPDGTVALGTYGSVRVTGLTLPEIRKVLENHLSAYLLNPEISVDVQNYNSKIFYVVLDGGGAGQTIFRMPITGNETVLDAIAEAKGISTVSSKDRIWVARPAPEGCGHQILPVNWKAVVEWGDTATNYQIMPGDRVFVAAYPLSALDTTLARIIAPIERIFGTILLGNGAVQSFTPGLSGGGF